MAGRGGSSRGGRGGRYDGNQYSNYNQNNSNNYNNNQYNALRTAGRSGGSESIAATIQYDLKTESPKYVLSCYSSSKKVNDLAGEISVEEMRFLGLEYQRLGKAPRQLDNVMQEAIAAKRREFDKLVQAANRDPSKLPSAGGPTIHEHAPLIDMAKAGCNLNATTGAAHGFGPAPTGFGQPARSHLPLGGPFGTPTQAPFGGATAFGAPQAPSVPAPAPVAWGAALGNKPQQGAGFGASAAPSQPGFGAPAPVSGFGAPSPGFGVSPGFGAPAAPVGAGFGGGVGNFGAPAAPGGGFGAPSAPGGGGFGVPAAVGGGGFGALGGQFGGQAPGLFNKIGAQAQWGATLGPAVTGPAPTGTVFGSTQVSSPAFGNVPMQAAPGFGMGMGQPSASPPGQAPVHAVAGLSAEDVAAFQADQFAPGKIPETAPPMDLC